MNALPFLESDELWPLLLRFYFERVVRHFLRVVGEFDLSPPQAHLLLHSAQGRALSQREHAKLLGCDPSNLTGLTDRLEGRGLVERRVDPDDRRVKVLVLTEKGEVVRTQLSARLAEAPDVVAGLAAEDQETLRALLRKLCQQEAKAAALSAPSPS
jgi:DNA-binding MarR family transcriptional regulator